MSTLQPKQSELGIVNGVPLPEMPEDLFIPPQALETVSYTHLRAPRP